MSEHHGGHHGQEGAAEQGKPRKQVFVNVEEQRSVEDIGKFLVEIGQKLAGEGSFSLSQGGQSYQVAPSGQVELEVQYKTKGDKHTFEVEIEWWPGREGFKIE